MVEKSVNRAKKVAKKAKKAPRKPRRTFRDPTGLNLVVCNDRPTDPQGFTWTLYLVNDLGVPLEHVVVESFGFASDGPQIITTSPGRKEIGSMPNETAVELERFDDGELDFVVEYIIHAICMGEPRLGTVTRGKATWLPPRGPVPVLDREGSVLLVGLYDAAGAKVDLRVLLPALQFAADKHRSQRRKDMEASPYINHPIAVVNVLFQIGDIRDTTTLVAGVLHDTIEDTETTGPEIEAAFGAEVRAVVEEVTDDKRLPKDERKQLQIEHASTLSKPARQVKIADKITNLEDLVDRPPSDWGVERKREYVAWACAVVDKVRAASPRLERRFDEVARRCRKQFEGA